METTQVCAVEPVVALVSQDGIFEEQDRIYENVRLSGPDEEKLVRIADAILFYLHVARLRTRPVTITEDCGCLTISWSRYAPHVFAGQRLLELVADGQQVDLFTVQDSATVLAAPSHLRYCSRRSISESGNSFP